MFLNILGLTIHIQILIQLFMVSPPGGSCKTSDDFTILYWLLKEVGVYLFTFFYYNTETI